MTLPKITPFRAALTIGSSTIAGGILYDRWRCDQIRGELLERARVMGSRPMHDPLQAARHVEVFLSAGDKGEVCPP